MARINIEDSLWMDDRFLMLVESTANRASAIGAIVLAFKTAQRFWIPDQLPIPSVQFRSIPFASDLLSSGLAEYTDQNQEFVYVKGTREQFSWLLQRSKAGSENKGKKRERNQTEPERNQTEGERVRTSSSSSSSFSEEKEKNIYSRAEILECLEVWQGTLNRMGIQKKANLDEVAIAQLVQAHGVDKTKLALLGAGFESASKDYDPKSHISIQRLKKPSLFDTFVNLGAQRTAVAHDVYEGEGARC